MAFEFHETFTVPLPNVEYDLSSFSESAYKDKHGLIVEIAAIHEGVTQNFTQYSSAELANALHTWYTPYQKPIIMNHDKMSEPVGRVIGAKMDQEEDGTPYVRLQAAIVDPTAIQKVLDRRYITGSIGGKTDEAICSVCGTDWAHPKEGLRGMPCPHQRGRVYKGKLATLEMRNITFVEYSFVNVPADAHSGVRAINKAEESDGWNHTAKFFVLDLSSESIVECREGVEGGVDILGEMRKKDASPLYHEIKGAFIQARMSNNIENEESAIAYIGDTTDNVGGIETSSEEKESMANEEHVDTAEQDEDILAITEGLSDDLNAAVETEEASDDSAEATEQSEAEETDADTTTESDDQSETEEAEQAQDTTAEAEDSDDASDTRESEESETVEEAVEEEGEAVAEGDQASEQADDTDLTETNAVEAEHDVDELQSRVTALEEENARLKKALHRTLAERVVDAKITAGLEESSRRAEAIEEHAGRTASSLADSLRDLAAMPKMVATEREMPTGVVEPKIAAVEGEENVDTVDAEVEEEAKDPTKAFEDLLTDTLMGRRAL
jgi:hypothetical protein